jgi:hypothetical protein
MLPSTPRCIQCFCRNTELGGLAIDGCLVKMLMNFSVPLKYVNILISWAAIQLDFSRRLYSKEWVCRLRLLHPRIAIPKRTEKGSCVDNTAVPSLRYILTHWDLAKVLPVVVSDSFVCIFLFGVSLTVIIQTSWIKGMPLMSSSILRLTWELVCVTAS